MHLISATTSGKSFIFGQFLLQLNDLLVSTRDFSSRSSSGSKMIKLEPNEIPKIGGLETKP